ncbi:TIGR03118 family protein [Paraburkholderia sp. CNPSo 3155]|uniref:TIGR03118 family protein n=1 Tax=Paraburkholderia atlantica TaxID=2654982 RepID=UPI00128CBA44|nr:TIGR03118 family protein [Paraburkholderia atlantica]MPW08897.1 TIGR03118 family protein [Paraburkholderia atlantica]
MSQISRGLKAAALIVLAAGFTTGHAVADDAYVVKPLVSNVAGAAPKVDGVLQNAWGIAFSPAGSPFWINDNATGCSTLYDGEGTKVTTLQVAIPLPGNVIPAGACHAVLPKSAPNPTPAAPTGIVWNPSSAFLVPGTHTQAVFIFATEDGTLSAWAGGLNPANNAVIAVDNSSNPSAASGAVYKGLVFGVNAQGGFLFATNFRSGRIDVFGPNGSDGLFTPATTDGGFADANIPAGYAPFGIANIDGDLFVTYAKQDKQKHDDDAGRGRGFVDVFDTDGHLLRRFASRGPLDSPWGIARASFAFGRFSGKILIGNFGDGRINVFDNDGTFVDQLENEFGNPLAIDGLWTLTLGGGRNSSPDTLYFSAGPNKETNGLFGIIAPASGSGERASGQHRQ